MKVLVIGSGGRDHSIAWKFSQSPRVKKLYVAHGNAGISQVAECVNAQSVVEMVAFAAKERIDLTFVGPESPLSAGIVDRFQEQGLAIVGPTQAASRLESSKSYAKVIMRDLGIPVAEFAVFDDPARACDYIIIRPVVGSYGHFKSWEAETTSALPKLSRAMMNVAPENEPAISGALAGGTPSFTHRTR